MSRRNDLIGIGVLCAIAAVLAAGACALGRMPVRQPVDQQAVQPVVQPAGAASRPALDETAAWGAESKGLAIRLLAKGRYVQGEPADFTLEVKNVSKEKKFILDVFDPQYTKVFTMTVKGPDGKPLSTGQYGGYSFPASDFKPIEPNEVWRIDFANAGDRFTAPDKKTKLYVPGFREEGIYTVQCSYMSFALPADGKGVTDELKEGHWQGKAVSNEITFAVRRPTKEEFRVHEWGVFTVQAGVAHANASLKGEWATLPECFYRQFPLRKLRFMPLMVNKPIVYFYSSLPSLRVKATVRFADGGAPVVWWPAAEYPFDGGMGSPLGERMSADPNSKGYFDYLTWSGWLGEKVPEGPMYGGGHRPGETVYEEVAETRLPADSWVMDARIKGPLPITVRGSESGRGGLRRNGPNSRETERFLFYDGLVKVGDWLSFVGRDEKGVTLQSAAKFDIGPVFLLCRADEKSADVKFAAATAIKAGAKETISFTATTAKDFNVKAPVRKALLATGLYEAEVDSILKIWDKGFFDRAGLTAIYLLPQAEYDRLLPLQVDPVPAETLRVGIVLCPRLEVAGEVAKVAGELLKKLDADDYKTREAATKGLLDLGPAVIPQVEAYGKSASSAEVQTRCREILESLDAGQWLRDALKPKSK